MRHQPVFVKLFSDKSEIVAESVPRRFINRDQRSDPLQRAPPQENNVPTPSFSPEDPTNTTPPHASAGPATALRQLSLQFAAVIAVLSLAWPYFGLRDEALPWPDTALAMGAIAFLLARITRQPIWWQLIHASFAPLAWAVSLLEIPPGWFLLTFLALLLVFRGAATGQIPLYLTNAATTRALAELLQERNNSGHFSDLGAGIGSTVVPLARALPNWQFSGVENAPASWWIGRLRTRKLTNTTWLLSDFWQTPLGNYDVAYAFLSPAPMPSLWTKIEHEMKPGSLFISNSFPVPDVDPDEIFELDDPRQTRLYCYRVADKPKAGCHSD